MLDIMDYGCRFVDLYTVEKCADFYSYLQSAQLICPSPFARTVKFSPDAVNIIPYSTEMKCFSLKCFKVSKYKVYEFGHFIPTIVHAHSAIRYILLSI